MTNDIFCEKKHIHFIGIGGTGMFPLAQILRSKGFYITGSDISQSNTLEQALALGISVFLGHHAKNIEGADLIVYSSAIMEDNDELRAAKSANVSLIERMVILGSIVNRYPDSVCISGTHGKTTTTGMLTQILLSAGVDPTAIIGGTLDIINGNGRLGKGKVVVCEACEYKDTFLQLNPTLAVILNIDYDHMDYFQTMDDYVSSFKKFIDKTKKFCLINGDDESCLLAAKDTKTLVKTFGMSRVNDYFPTNILQHSTSHQSFEFNNREKVLGKVELRILGRHNVSNAVAAIACALELDVTFDECIQGIREFSGVRRRFTTLAVLNGITVIDDYAHHPTEIKATLQMARDFNFNRIWAIFQPHTFSRVASLIDDFVQALALADKIIVTEIFSAREKNIYSINSKNICDKIDEAQWFDTFEKVRDYAVEHARTGDAIITMGGGDVYKVANMIVEGLRHSTISNNQEQTGCLSAN